ncbi:MAG: hypothetical protein K8S16_11740 [Bacteroidales bacterium]|nr:hypothetical protein [Bacteroidales bacterium]
MKCTHKFSHYKESLEKARKLDYHFLKLNEYPEIEKHKKVIILRHDVDLSLENSLKMAKIENELGIQSTFFIRLSAKYNSMYYPNIELIKSILILLW